MTGSDAPKKRRGFAAMSPEKQRELARQGGRTAHARGTAHRWTSEEARAVTHKRKPQAHRYSCGDCWVRFHRRREVCV